MLELNVGLAERYYPIYIGEGLLENPDLYSPFIAGKKVMLVTNETVSPLYERQVRKALSNYEVDTVILPDGEQYKDWQTLNLIFTALLENGASEQGARMSAMDSATRNAGDMIDKLTIEYNRSRQAVITNELIEIISGAEAL